MSFSCLKELIVSLTLRLVVLREKSGLTTVIRHLATALVFTLSLNLMTVQPLFINLIFRVF